MDITPCGFPHSDISGSMLVCSSPKLFAAYHVLLRLLTPRHPSCALSSLTTKKQLKKIVQLSLNISCLHYDFCHNTFFLAEFSSRLLQLSKQPRLITAFAHCFTRHTGSTGKSSLHRRLPMKIMVGVLGFEPRTSSLSGTRSNQLSYTPMVEPKGLEPSAFCLQSRHSTN